MENATTAREEFRHVPVFTVDAEIRYRINISRGMKGAISFEATVDAEGLEMEEVLARSDQLVAALEARYPMQTGQP